MKSFFSLILFCSASLFAHDNLSYEVANLEAEVEFLKEKIQNQESIIESLQKEIRSFKSLVDQKLSQKKAKRL